jgi:hypothetical protein
MEIPRRKLGVRADFLYADLDSSTIGFDDAIAEMVNAGIPGDLATRIVEEATGLAVENFI